MYSIVIALLTLVTINAASLPRCFLDDIGLDIIFMVDSSGSVYDDEYKNWENELDLVYDIIDNQLPMNSKVGLINFSGCGSSFTFQQCKEQNRMKKVFGLNDYRHPNNLTNVLSAVEAIDQDDFNSGYTWIEEAFHMALTEFNANSTADRMKMIVLITAGEPYPSEQGHEPCKTSTGYISPTITYLNALLGVNIVTVGIDISEDIKEEYFDCISDADSDKNTYFDATFNSSLAEAVSDDIGDLICPESTGHCSSTNELELDIVLLIDSSGSVFSDGYNNWYSQLHLVQDIVESLPEDKSRVSLINFSGCGSSFSFDQCKEQGRLNTVFELDTYTMTNSGSDANVNVNDLELVKNRIAEMGADDFNGGYTWTNEALSLALAQFTLHSNDEKTKVIILLTDSEPYPADAGHEPCKTSTDYKSPTLTGLNNLGVNIITIGIDITDSGKETLECISPSSYIPVSGFSELDGSFALEIEELICDYIDGDFSQ